MFIIERTIRGGYYWYVKDAGNNETLCHSEEYVSKQGALNGIAAVKRIVPSAPIQDNT